MVRIFKESRQLGNMSPYVTSYLRSTESSDIRYSNSIWVYSAISVATPCSILIGLSLAKFQISLKKFIAMGCLVMW
jgi:hypothetical protein